MNWDWGCNPTTGELFAPWKILHICYLPQPSASPCNALGKQGVEARIRCPTTAFSRPWLHVAECRPHLSPGCRRVSLSSPTLLSVQGRGRFQGSSPTLSKAEEGFMCPRGLSAVPWEGVGRWVLITSVVRAPHYSNLSSQPIHC